MPALPPLAPLHYYFKWSYYPAPAVLLLKPKYAHVCVVHPLNLPWSDFTFQNLLNFETSDGRNVMSVGNRLDSETMSEQSKRSTEFNSYPFLNVEEFAETCHRLDRRYTQATLGPLRRRWKLRVCRALDISFTASADYATYIQIIRSLDGELDDGDLSACLDKFSFGDDSPGTNDMADQEMMESEESDQVKFSCLRVNCWPAE